MSRQQFLFLVLMILVVVGVSLAGGAVGGREYNLIDHESGKLMAEVGLSLAFGAWALVLIFFHNKPKGVKA